MPYLTVTCFAVCGSKMIVSPCNNLKHAGGFSIWALLQVPGDGRERVATVASAVKVRHRYGVQCPEESGFRHWL